jgi:hypothetical protein
MTTTEDKRLHDLEMLIDEDRKPTASKSLPRQKSCPLKFSNPNRHDWKEQCDGETCEWFEGGPHQVCSVRMIAIALRISARWSGPE